MAAHETILAHVLSLAQLRSAPALAAIGRELDRNPHRRFQRFGTSDPPRTKIDTAEAALGSWRPGPKDEHRAWTFFLSRPADPAGRASLDITTMDPTRARYAHDVSATYRASHFTNTERLDEIADLLRRVAEATGAFYGRAALGAIYDQHNLLFERPAARQRATSASSPTCTGSTTSARATCSTSAIVLRRSGPARIHEDRRRPHMGNRDAVRAGVRRLSCRLRVEAHLL